MLLGIGYPSQPEELKVSSFWRAFYICPLIFTPIALFMNLSVHTSDSLTWHIERDEKKEAMDIIARMYVADGKPQLHEDIYK